MIRPSILALLLSSVSTGALAAEDTNALLLERLEKLESRVQALESENHGLKEQLEFTTERLEHTEQRAGKIVQPNVAPTIGDVAGDFSFKVRGVVDGDLAFFNERKGGYDYNNGTSFRRARLGFEGTAFKNFPWRMEAEFAGNQVVLLDAYLQYTGIKKWTFTLGQHKAPFGLESNSSDSYNTFLERGMFTNAFGTAGAERRLGASAQYASGAWTAAFGVYGDSEAQNRTNAGPDESWGLNGRLTWDPVNDSGRVVHLGASGYWRTSLKTAPSGAATTATVDSIRLTERPNIRVDGGNIADTGVITSVSDLYYVGAEAAVVHGPLALVGEYGRLTAVRTGALKNVSFDGFYVYGSWMLTGESRPFKNGLLDRVRPFDNFDPARGSWGAVELAVRYDRIDLGDTPVAARAGNDAASITTALNWYFNPNMKLQFNWIRFTGDNTPLDPVGTRTAGDAFATRLHIDW